jgi:hypothetical protein
LRFFVHKISGIGFHRPGWSAVPRRYIAIEIKKPLPLAISLLALSNTWIKTIASPVSLASLTKSKGWAAVQTMMKIAMIVTTAKKTLFPETRDMKIFQSAFEGSSGLVRGC